MLDPMSVVHPSILRCLWLPPTVSALSTLGWADAEDTERL